MIYQPEMADWKQLLTVLMACSIHLAFGATRTSGNESGQRRNESIECADLQPGQYYCKPPDIDPDTQQARNCSRENKTVKVACYPVQGIKCSGATHTGETVGFTKNVPCKWTNGVKFETSLLLSVFLGMFGVDRFYLGYPAIGLVKFCTLGFMFLGQLVDIVLIATQVVGPADGSDYIIAYYGAGLSRMDRNNFTYVKPQYDAL